MELELVPIDDPSYGEDKEEEDGLAYNGPDRRIRNRRVTPDRRKMIRFESKPDRRSGQDRRKAQQLWETREI